MVSLSVIHKLGEVRFQQLMRALTRVFQITLLKLEQLSFVFFEVAGIVVCDVGPLQYLSASNDFLGTFLKEFELLHRIQLHFVQFLHILLYLFNLLLGNIPGPRMVHVPLKVVHVSLQLIL